MDACPRCARSNGFERIDERFAVFQILAPRGDLDAGNDDLSIALRGERRGLGRAPVLRQGEHAPAGVGNDAVGTEIVAPVLDF